MITTQLHWADWLLFALTLVISMAIGVYFALAGDRQRTTKEYLIANRKLSMVPVAISMFMSFMSAIWLIGQTAEVYLHGTQIIIGLIGDDLGAILNAIIFVPAFHKLKLISVYEYINMRFESKALHMLCVCLQILYQVVFMGFAMYAPATALEGVTGFPTWASVLLMGGVTTIYTTIGGMKAVVWTDTFQGFVLFSGLIAVCVLGTNKVGGLSRVWEISKEGGRHNWINFNPDPTQRLNFWILIVGNMVSGMVFFGTNQNNIQRYCSLPTLTKARMSVLSTMLCTTIISLMVWLTGLVMFSYYHSLGCDPLRAHMVSSPNQLFPYFVVTVLNYPGLPGVFFAVLYAGALSTISSTINALSAITWRDILQNRCAKLPEHRKALVTKILVLIYGCVGVLAALIAPFFPGHIMQVTIRVLTGIQGPITGVLILGILFPFANALGSGIGAIAAFALCTWINIGATVNPYHLYTIPTRVDNCTFGPNVTAIPNPTNPPEESVFPLYRISFMLIAMVALIPTVAVGVIISLISGGEKPERRNPKYIIPLSRYFCCCLPQSMQKFLSCGLDYSSQSHGEAEKEADQNAISTDEQPIKSIANSVQSGDVQSAVTAESRDIKIFRKSGVNSFADKTDGINLQIFKKFNE